MLPRVPTTTSMTEAASLYSRNILTYALCSQYLCLRGQQWAKVRPLEVECTDTIESCALQRAIMSKYLSCQCSCQSMLGMGGDNIDTLGTQSGIVY